MPKKTPAKKVVKKPVVRKSVPKPKLQSAAAEPNENIIRQAYIPSVPTVKEKSGISTGMVLIALAMLVLISVVAYFSFRSPAKADPWSPPHMVSAPADDGPGTGVHQTGVPHEAVKKHHDSDCFSAGGVQFSGMTKDEVNIPCEAK